MLISFFSLLQEIKTAATEKIRSFSNSVDATLESEETTATMEATPSVKEAGENTVVADNQPRTPAYPKAWTTIW